jgi:hypothetical protein
MRKGFLITFALLLLLPAAAGGAETLAIRAAGKSISQTDGDVWIYWEVYKNPYDYPVGYGLRLTERDENGKVLGVRQEDPCSPETHNDIFDKEMLMVPPKGSIIVFYPPLWADSQSPEDAEIYIVEECGLQTFWGLYPTNEVELVEEVLSPEGDLHLTVEATERLEGKAFVQIQVSLLNKSGEVIQTRYTIAGKFNRIEPGERAQATIIDLDSIAFSEYKVTVLGFYSKYP